MIVGRLKQQKIGVPNAILFSADVKHFFITNLFNRIDCVRLIENLSGFLNLLRKNHVCMNLTIFF